MVKTQNIRYKVFLFQKVKKKVKFFDTETYPLQIRVTAGSRTLYLRSYFFHFLQQKKYTQELKLKGINVTLDDIIELEDKLMSGILASQVQLHSVEAVKNAYSFLCRDILHELDEGFKEFLADFFYNHELPAYSYFIRSDGINHTSEFILQTLEKSLQPAVYARLLMAAVEAAPPYIPVIAFFREKIKARIPVLPVFTWMTESAANDFTAFVHQRYQEYEKVLPGPYLSRLVHHSHSKA